MYKDIISYELAENVTEKQLLDVAKEIVETWMKKQKGFVAWEIHKNSSGGLTDIVYWESEADAKIAEKEMVNIPNAAAWFACYQENSVSSLSLNRISRF